MQKALLVLGVALVVSAIACSSKSSDTPAQDPATTCPQDNPQCREAATVEAGQQAVAQRRCVDCHTQTLAGSVTPIPVQNAPPEVKLYPPNLTSDEATGLGTWTDEQIALAVRTGVDNTSLELCPQMKHFSTMTDFEVFSIVKYLRSVPKVSQKIPRSVCPPLKG
jgi:hypothetical protein